jgi:hypothetical protein
MENRGGIVDRWALAGPDRALWLSSFIFLPGLTALFFYIFF